jgi:GT2 family glycosyltransferase
MQAPKVYIILLNYRQWEDSRECLESVLRSTYNNFSVFVIDNDSRNNSLEQLISWFKEKTTNEAYREGRGSYVLLNRRQLNDYINVSELPKLVFIQNDENAGFAAGNNIVLNLLRNTDAYFWLLNPDMVIEMNTLAELVQFSIQLPRESIVGSVLQSYSENQGLICYGGARVNFLSATVAPIQSLDCVQRLDYISGGSLFAHTSNLNRLGMLPEKYFLYWEETDWCYSAKQMGYVLHVCTRAVCYDKGSTSIGKTFKSDYYYARNGLLFISKFRPKNVPFVLFFLGIRFLKRIMTGHWERARGIYKGTKDFFKMQPDDRK